MLSVMVWFLSTVKFATTQYTTTCGSGSDARAVVGRSVAAPLTRRQRRRRVSYSFIIIIKKFIK